jgi:VanZ family protein
VAPTERARSAGVVGLAALAGVGVLLLLPTSRLPSELMWLLVNALRDAGAPAWLTSVVLWERVLNVLLFVPLGVLGALLRPRWPLLRWVVLGVALSGALETVQSLLPDRDASPVDVLANAAGVVLGAAAVLVTRSHGRLVLRRQCTKQRELRVTSEFRRSPARARPTSTAGPRRPPASPARGPRGD